ncbi:PTS transporter subunit EIIC [Streptococcus porci]|uniref:PTS transporter subunit EIIC n=1 Tax=Streptococcus porci TaxID=502567 RepID=UPI00042413A7|nr:PTS transporter subunit EIIC [Streptococcus porci]
MANNKEIAQKVLSVVGGAENINSVVHCMTRLRFNLKNRSLVNDDEVRKIDGVIGVVNNNQQYQVVIGTNVPKVYDELCQLGNFTKEKQIDENLDAGKVREKLTLKTLGNNILNYMSRSMTPLIPVMLAAGLFKALNAVLGPSLLNLYPETSNLYLLFNFIFDAGFYFLPIFVGINAAQQLKMESLLGGFIGAILIAPGLIALVNEQKSFDILGLPVPMNNYSQTVIPVMLSVYFMSLVYKVVKKYMPDVLTTLLTPFLSVLITVPVALCFLAPLGSQIGSFISGGLLAFSDKTGFIGSGIMGAIWQFLVMTGMHLALMMPMLASFFETGQMSGAAIAAGFSIWACFGVALGASLRLKDKKKRSTAIGAFISGIIGGVTEPTLYGICFTYRRCFIGLMLGGFVGGAYSYITNATTYVMSSANFLYLISFTGGTTANLVNGIISCLLSMIVAAVVTYLFGFKKEELDRNY